MESNTAANNSCRTKTFFPRESDKKEGKKKKKPDKFKIDNCDVSLNT